MRQAVPAASQRIDSFADILLSFGFGDAAVLGESVRAWVRLFETVQPHSVVLDYAPAAQLAAQLLGLRVFQVSNGFDAPPAHCPVFGIALRGPYVERLNMQKLARLNVTMGQVGRDITGRPSPALEAYFNHPTKVYDCIAHTDPYGPRKDGMYVGPLAAAHPPSTAVDATSWLADVADHPHDPHIFAYLRNVPQPGEWLDALCQVPARTLCVWPDVPDELLQSHCNSRVRITRQPVNMHRALAQADAVLNYGSTTTVCQTLLAGKPQLMLPMDIEKMLVAQKVEQQGAGLVWRKGRSTCVQALQQLLQTSRLATAAQAVAAQYSAVHMQHCQDLFAQALVKKSSQHRKEDAR